MDETRSLPLTGTHTRWGVEVSDSEGDRHVVPVLSREAADRLVGKLDQIDPHCRPVVVTCVESVARTEWMVAL